MPDEWFPPATDGATLLRLTAVEGGFPPYLRTPVVEWVIGTTYYRGRYLPALAQNLGLRLKMEMPTEEVRFRSFLHQVDDDILVRALDAMFYFEIMAAVTRSSALFEILEAGSSVWTVAGIDEKRPRLVQKLPSGLSQAFGDVTSKSALAGKLLAEAFEATYGAVPNPNHAYDLCVKAVETLACPAFIPKNTSRATLGAVISHLERKAVSLPLIEKNATHGDTITRMMRLLWEGGQRHGNGNYEHVSLEGARTAQALAFSLVALIHEGLITTD